MRLVTLGRWTRVGVTAGTRNPPGHWADSREKLGPNLRAFGRSVLIDLWTALRCRRQSPTNDSTLANPANLVHKYGTMCTSLLSEILTLPLHNALSL